MPGPLGSSTNSPVIDAGTLMLTASRPPVPTGVAPDAGLPLTSELRTAYVNKVGSDGWLKTQLGDSGPPQYVFLCKYTAVSVIESKGGRTYFKALDGTYAGKVLSLAHANVATYLAGAIHNTKDRASHHDRWGRVASQGFEGRAGGPDRPDGLAERGKSEGRLCHQELISNWG